MSRSVTDNNKNGLGHRIGKQEKQELCPTVKVDYVLDLTKSYHNLLQKEENGKRQTFLWDGNVAGIINEDSAPDFYFQDELGSPIRVADMEGMLRETNGYDEFGQNLYQKQGQTQPFGYTGYQSDRISGTYYAQAREYAPSIGKFASRDLDQFIKIQDTRSINLYSYCMSNPIRYIDPSGNSLEDILNEQYPTSITHDGNEAVQINISGNSVTIDVYVEFFEDNDPTTGNGPLLTPNGTSCRDLAVAGIEQWSGYYLDVFGEDIQVTVNVHERDSYMDGEQRYVEINLISDNLKSNATFRGNSSYGTINVSRKNPNDALAYTDEQYVRVVAHEMGHVFGIMDGYKDSEKVPERPDASKLGIVKPDDIMVNNLGRLNISSTDIGMLLFAYQYDQAQYFVDYNGYTQSEYIKLAEEKE